MALAWRWRPLAFLVVCCGIFFVARVCVTVVRRPGAEQFPVSPGQWFIISVYACAFTCGRSFTVLSVRGVLISFRVF